MVAIAAQMIPCLGCKRKLRVPEPQASHLEKYDTDYVVFCGLKCNRAFVSAEGIKQQELVAAMQELAEQ